MKRLPFVVSLAFGLIMLSTLIARGQSQEMGNRLYREGQDVEARAHTVADLEKAINLYEQALVAFDKAKYEMGKGAALNNIGLIYNNLGKYEKALDYYNRSLMIRKKISHAAGEAVTLQNIATVYWNLGQHNKSIEYFEQSLLITKKTADAKQEGITLNNIGQVYVNLGQYEKALEYSEKALGIARRLSDIRQQWITLNNMGTIYWNLGLYEKALDHYQKSLGILKRTSDTSAQRTILNNIGQVQVNLGQYAMALESFRQSSQMARKIGDSKQEGITLNNIGAVYKYLGKYKEALENYKLSLGIHKKIGDISGEGVALINIATLYWDLGQYGTALDYNELALQIAKKTGEVKQEGHILGNIGAVYRNLGKYNKALEFHEHSQMIFQKIGDVPGQTIAIINIGNVYSNLGQYDKALKYFEQAVLMVKNTGDLEKERHVLSQVAHVHALQDKYSLAIKVSNESLSIEKKLGIPSEQTIDRIANYYLDAGDLEHAEPLIAQTRFASSLGRLALIKADYSSAIVNYSEDSSVGQKTGDVETMFRSLVGLGLSYEGTSDYLKAEECYEKAMNLTEEIRSGLLPSERTNFFEVKIGGFQRSEAAKGLTRVRMKRNNPEGSIVPSELTKARSFSDHLSVTAASVTKGLPQELQEKEQSVTTELAALKKDIQKTDAEKLPEKHENLNRLINEAKNNLSQFIEKLRREYPAYAAFKYPKPISLHDDSALQPDEHVLIFDVSDKGVAVILCAGKRVKKSFFVDVKRKDLEKEVQNFREPIQKLRFDRFNVELARSLYNRFIKDALTDVPRGVPLVIITDGILGTLPFESLVVAGEPIWEKGAINHQYPVGLRYLVDEHPIIYYPSLTALSLTRKFGSKTHMGNRMLVLADPVFSMKDARVKQASQIKISENEKKYNIQIMKAIEDSFQGVLIMGRLENTLLMAENFKKMYGQDCLALTGFEANKSDFMSKIAAKIDSYNNIVFATHGVMSTRIPGLMEPFLALTMCPPGTDGFLKMSDILSLKINADIVALTACQTGLGKDVSGEGVMSMGRAFQYAGAKSVLMTLWEVEEASAIKLTERFFHHRKDGKTKLDALQSAREDIKKEGYRHPYFWSGFILVGETD